MDAAAAPTIVADPVPGSSKDVGKAYDESKQVAQAFAEQSDFIGFEIEEDEEAATASDHGRPSQGQKRKRPLDDDGRGRRGAKKDAQGRKKPGSLKRKGKNATPWFDELEWEGKTVQQMLTAEIASFVTFIRPTPDEHELRTLVIEGIRRAVKKDWPDAEVYAFGSFGTKLYLPGGDIDLVILSKAMSLRAKPSVLYALSPLFSQSRIAAASDIVVIAKAKVPIIKFKTSWGGFSVDISINQSNGLQALKTVQEIIGSVAGGDGLSNSKGDANGSQRPEDDGDRRRRRGAPPSVRRTPAEEEAMRVVRELGPARCLIFVIKSLLKQRGMNEVFTGGLGSYSIICLVVSFLQLHPQIQAGEIEPAENLGVLLIEFFELYGKHFNYDNTGITLRQGGGYFSKHRRGWENPRSPYLLSIEDPANPDNDISSGSYNVLGVRAAFGGAFDLITATMYHRQSLLLSRATGGSVRPLLSVPIPTSSGGSGASTPNHRRFTEDGEIEDPLRQSLLGDIMGVTEDILEARERNLTLFAAGTVHKSLGLEQSVAATDGAVPSENGPATREASLSNPTNGEPNKATNGSATERDKAKQEKRKKRLLKKAEQRRNRRKKREGEEEQQKLAVAAQGKGSSGEEGEASEADIDGDSIEAVQDTRMQFTGLEPSVSDPEEPETLPGSQDGAEEEESRYAIASRAQRSQAPSLSTGRRASTTSASDGTSLRFHNSVTPAPPDEERLLRPEPSPQRKKMAAEAKRAMWLAKAQDKEAGEIPEDDYVYAEDDAVAGE